MYMVGVVQREDLEVLKTRSLRVKSSAERWVKADGGTVQYLRLIDRYLRDREAAGPAVRAEPHEKDGAELSTQS